jgi:hypothetical protein
MFCVHLVIDLPQTGTNGVVHRVHTTHRVAIADFWREIHHDRWGLHAHPLSLYLPSHIHTKLQCTLELRGQIHSPFFISTPMYSMVWSVRAVAEFIDLVRELKPALKWS